MKIGDKVKLKSNGVIGEIIEVHISTDSAIRVKYGNYTSEFTATRYYELVESESKMSNTEDKLFKQERIYLEARRSAILAGKGEWNDCTTLLAILDKIAPKPIELVAGNIAIADMLIREGAVYSYEKYPTSKIKFENHRFYYLDNSVTTWRVVNLTHGDYEARFIKVS